MGYSSSQIKYYDCKTSGPGHCWYCDAPTNFILDTPKEEIFCCFVCGIKHIKNSKIVRKVRNLEKSRIGDFRKNLHGENGQKSKEEGR